MEFLRPVTLLARLPGGAHVVDRSRNRLFVITGDHPPQLPGAVRLRANKVAGAAADVTGHAFYPRVRCVLIRDVLGLHRRVADLAAELTRLHVVNATVSGQRNDQRIDDSEGEYDRGNTTMMAVAEVDHRPVTLAWMQAIASSRPPHSRRDKEQPEGERGRDGDEDDDADVRVGESAEEFEDEENDEEDSRRSGDYPSSPRDRVAREIRDPQ